MSFLTPFMLWGGLAAGIPIALHFFYRSRYKTVPWAAMKFLLTSIEQTSRRLRFQELLLLVLRTVVLLLLALTLARPTFSGAGRGGDAVDAVILLDTSMSMTAKAGVVPPGVTTDPYLVALRSFAKPDGTVTCFDRARAAALAVVAGLPAASTVQIVSMSDRATLLGPPTPSHLDQAKKLLEDLTPTSLGTDFLPAVRLGADVLERGPSPAKEIYLVSDMQRTGWAARQGEIREMLAELRPRAVVHMIHCVPSAPVNVAIVGITPQTTLRPGERTDFAVLVRHSGTQPARNLTVTLEVDGKGAEKETRPVPEIAPGETRAVILSGLIDKPGRHLLTATVGPDDLDGDNRFDLVLQVADQAGVLIVDGAPDERDPRKASSYFLQHAINPIPSSGGLPVTVVPPDRAHPRDLGGKELCILVNTRLEASEPDEDRRPGSPLPGDFLRSLAPFVRDGGNVMIFSGDRVDPARYNAWLYERLPLMPFKMVKEEKTPQDRPWFVDRASADAPPFSRFRNEPAYASIDRIEVRRLIALDVPEKPPEAGESRVLLRYSNGRVAVASRQRPGQGEVMLFTTSVSDPAWSDWFVSPTFVPFVQVAVSHLLQGRPQALNRVAGQALVWQVPTGEAAEAFDLIDAADKRTRVGFAESVGGRPLVTSSELTRAGIYRLSPANREPSDETPLFAVTPEVGETEDLTCLTPAAIDERLGFASIHTTAGDISTDFSGGDLLTREWTPWLLIALLALVAFEMYFAWFCDQAPAAGPMPGMTVGGQV
jgi:hypothetical protein